MALSKILPASQAQYVGARNLIINGAMTVSQRGTVTGVTSAYGGPDRFLMTSSGGAQFTLSQDTDVPTGQGFASSFKADVTTADSSLAASDYAILFHRIEGQNLQHLKKGTSIAESVTLSFWIKSSTTGTYILELYDFDNTRQISKSYTVDTADTWEKKELTFAGDTSGALDNDNGLSVQVAWWLAAGSTYSSGTLNTSWASSTNANRAVGQVNAIDDVANNIFITGVQLEVGETATPFEHEDYGTTLCKCQRYFVRIIDDAVYSDVCNVSAWTTTAARGVVYLPPMRAAQTLASSGAFQVLGLGTVTSISITTSGADTSPSSITVGGSGYTVGYSGALRTNNDADAYIDFDAEL